MKKWLLKAWPYAGCIIVGTVLFIVAAYVPENTCSLLINIAAAFFAIPCLYVVYELAKQYSNKRLTKELFEYAKKQIDTEVLSILKQVIKIIHPYEEIDFTKKYVNTFLALSEVDIKNALQDNEYLGFQVLKEWSVSIKNTTAILQNPFILQRLNNDQVISVVNLLKCLTRFELISKRVPNLYEISDKQASGYKVVAGEELNARNTEYPNRYLLLRRLKEDEYKVADFGDFPLYQKAKLLNICKVNKGLIQAYVSMIFELVRAINDWLNCTGNELIIDPMMFKSAFPALSKNNNDKVI